MSHPVKGVDHVFLLVHDLERSRGQYERLGFTISPRGLHSQDKGTANHTIMFPQDYIELLGIVAQVPGNAARRDMLQRDGEGMRAIACRIDEARAAKQALSALDLPTGPVGDFERPVTLPDGTTAPAAFSAVAFENSLLPFGTVFMCQHKTPETVWLPELLHHANGAVALSGLIAQSPDPAEDAARLARLFAAGRATPVTGGAVVETGHRSASVSILSPQALQERYPGMDLNGLPARGLAGTVVRVADLAQTRACLDKQGIAFLPTTEGLAVPADLCSGAIVEFVAA